MARKQKEPDQLAKDAAAAKAARMSYGMWKAMNSNPVITGKTIPDGWKVCQCCGKLFKPKTKRPQKYCEIACQQQAYAARNREKNAERYRQWKAKKQTETGQT